MWFGWQFFDHLVLTVKKLTLALYLDFRIRKKKISLLSYLFLLSDFDYYAFNDSFYERFKVETDQALADKGNQSGVVRSKTNIVLSSRLTGRGFWRWPTRARTQTNHSFL